MSPFQELEDTFTSVLELFTYCDEAIAALQAKDASNPNEETLKFVRETYNSIYQQITASLNKFNEDASSKSLETIISKLKNECSKICTDPANISPIKESTASPSTTIENSNDILKSRVKFVTSPKPKKEPTDIQLLGKHLIKKTSNPKVQLDDKINLFKLVLDQKNADATISKLATMQNSNFILLEDVNLTNYAALCKEIDILLEVLRRWNFTQIVFRNVECLEYQWKKILDIIKSKIGISVIKLDTLKINNLCLWEEAIREINISSIELKNCTLKGLKELRWGEVFKFITANISSLKSVSYIRCGLEDMCAEDLKDALFKNNSITNLDISYNKFTRKGYKEIQRYTEKNSTIKRINFDGNPCLINQ